VELGRARLLKFIELQLNLKGALWFCWLHFINLKAEGSFTYLMGVQATTIAKGDEWPADHSTHTKFSIRDTSEAPWVE